MLASLGHASSVTWQVRALRSSLLFAGVVDDRAILSDYRGLCGILFYFTSNMTMTRSVRKETPGVGEADSLISGVSQLHYPQQLRVWGQDF